MKISAWVFFIFLLCLCSGAEALDERREDLSASVEVASVFDLSLNKPYLRFDKIYPGETKFVGEGGFFNEVRCRSNNGRSWMLTAQLLSGLKLAGKNYNLPVSSLRWKTMSVSSDAGPVGGYGFQKFDHEPSLIYISQGDDNLGKEVVLRFQYSLFCPEDAPGGEYSASIMFTMTEAP